MTEKAPEMRPGNHETGVEITPETLEDHQTPPGHTVDQSSVIKAAEAEAAKIEELNSKIADSIPEVAKAEEEIPAMESYASPLDRLEGIEDFVAKKRAKTEKGLFKSFAQSNFELLEKAAQKIVGTPARMESYKRALKIGGPDLAVKYLKALQNSNLTMVDENGKFTSNAINKSVIFE